jgi:hypothetical protein
MICNRFSSHKYDLIYHDDHEYERMSTGLVQNGAMTPLRLSPGRGTSQRIAAWRPPLIALGTTAGRAGSPLLRMWQPKAVRGAYANESMPRGEDMPNEKLRAEAAEKRRLAENARRLAGLMDQADAKKDLITQADTLEQLAQDLDELVRQHPRRR